VESNGIPHVYGIPHFKVALHDVNDQRLSEELSLLYVYSLSVHE